VEIGGITQGISADLISVCHNCENIIGYEVEVSFNKSYIGERGFDEVHALLSKNGMRIYDMDQTYWKSRSGRHLAGQKGMLIYADALYLPDESKFTEWKIRLTEDQIVDRLSSILIICDAYNIHEYFLYALDFFDSEITNNFTKDILKINKQGWLSKIFGSNKIMILSSLLRDLSDVLQLGVERYSFTTHTMGNRSRNPRFKFLRR